jgi:VCBS repeat protein/FG-GAP repeat protein
MSKRWFPPLRTIAASICFTFGLQTLWASSASQVFFAPPLIAPNFNANMIAAGDFNGDGIPDLAMASNSGVSIALGKGDGTFRPRVTYAVGGVPLFITVADLNGDGHLDLVTANVGRSVSVLLGNGDGTFKAAVNYKVLGGPQGIAVGDFNGDGKPDLLVGCDNQQYSSGLSLLLNNGDGTFGQAKNFDSSLAPLAVVAGDFNDDGKLDAATINRNGVSVILGNGDGTFQAPVTYATGQFPEGLAVGDLNGDGNLDLVAANYENSVLGSVSILLGNGDGSFRAPVNIDLAVGMFHVVLDDVNHDGKLDLLVSGDAIAVLKGNGDGTFKSPDYYATNADTGGPGSAPAVVAAADFNRDGNLDLAVGNGPAGVNLFLGNHDGTFQANRSFAVYSGVGLEGGSFTLAVGDFNNDGKLDLVTTSVGVILGKGDGTFGAPIYSTGPSSGMQAIAVGDFNGDGKLDLAGVSLDSGLYVMLGNGDGTFQKPVYYGVGGSSYFLSLAAADFNHDGKLDVVASGVNGVVSIWLGNGDGTFKAGVGYPAGQNTVSVAVGDFNNDGNPDVVTTGWAGSCCIYDGVVLLGNGDGTFQAPIPFPLGGLLLGNGNGTFQSPVGYSVNLSSGQAVVADFNRDGKLDVATASTSCCPASGYAINLLLGKGDGTFQSEAGYLLDNDGVLAVGDFNGDGAPDLAITSPVGVTILMNNNGKGRNK